MIKISDIIKPEDFYSDSNSKIYEILLNFFESQKPIDLVTISTALKDKKIFDEIGGAKRLAELTIIVPSSSHIFEYAQIVKKKATLRKMIVAGDKIIGLAKNPEKDISELLEEAEKEVFSISQTFLRDKFVPIKSILNERFEVFAERHNSEEEISAGIPTGYRDLDKYLSGLHPTDMIVLAARPSMGKTAFALSLALNVALEEKKSVGIFSLEMGKEQLVDRVFASVLGVDSWKLQKGKLSDNDFSKMGDVMDQLSEAPIFIDDSVGSTMPEVRAKARRLQMEHGLDFLIVDYLQLISTGNHGAYAGNRVQEISEISRSFKALARELHIPIMVLSQLSRGVEQRPDKRPLLSDLRESGAIEQDADVVMMIYRDEYYDEESEKKGIADVLIKKHRNGPVGDIELKCDLSRMRFFDI